MLNTHSAAIAFDRTLFSNLNLHVGRGEIVGISGESGCGKTSLLRAIMGFVPLSAGSIEVDGLTLDVQHVHEIRRRTAYVPQELQPPVEKGRDLIRLTLDLEYNHPSTTSQNAAVKKLMSELGLEESLLDLDASKLSGGQRQRLLLVSALALHKPLLLLDEPSSALDEDSTQRIGRALQHACHTDHRSALIISHDPSLLHFCDRVLSL